MDSKPWDVMSVTSPRFRHSARSPAACPTRRHRVGADHLADLQEQVVARDCNGGERANSARRDRT
jgi:hypothetical protein